MIAPDHPAVQAAVLKYLNTRRGNGVHDAIAAALTAALPHLTADDLRHTDAAEEFRTEGWQQGWAAGRDLDGDEDATPHLRDTPVGRALMAEGWSAALVQLDTLAQTYDEKGDHPMAEDLRFTHGRIAKRNPYLEADQ